MGLPHSTHHHLTAQKMSSMSPLSNAALAKEQIASLSVPNAPLSQPSSPTLRRMLIMCVNRRRNDSPTNQSRFILKSYLDDTSSFSDRLVRIQLGLNTSSAPIQTAPSNSQDSAR